MNAAWRTRLLGFVVVCVLGLYAVAAAHHHGDAAAEEACAVCHAVGHQPLDAPPAPLLVVLALPAWLAVVRFRLAESRAARPRPNRHGSRAPPRGGIA